MRRTPRRHGTLLIEMIAALTLLSVAAMFASQFMMTSVTTMNRLERQREGERRVDHMVNRLRADVWSARAVRVDAQALTLDGERVRWSFEPGDERHRVVGRVRRHGADADDDGFDLPVLPRLGEHALGVVVHLDEQRVILVSQHLVADAREEQP
ncbi:MAG: type II secretion system protein [Phycisphaeraceae bacterium]